MISIVHILKDCLDSLKAKDGLPARFVIAYSGGIDSTVLLHALARLKSPIPLLAVHVDHQLCDASATWEEHCKEFADSLGIDYVSRQVDVDAATGGGPEAAARAARYAVFETIIQKDDWLLSAHHESDQAETLLLNLFRGSGLAGLAAIGLSRPFAQGRLVRPLLTVGKQEIEAYAKRENLLWIDDPSNAESRFDRNFLRSDIVPRLEPRWPALIGRLARSAELAGEANGLLDDLAKIDLESAGEISRLDIKVVAGLSVARQRNLLRYAIRKLGMPAPPSKRLSQVVNELIGARADAQPLVQWPGAEVRRFRNKIYLLEAQPPNHSKTVPLTLRSGAATQLGAGLGTLCLRQSDGMGIDPAKVALGLDIGFRRGGETIRPVGRRHTHTLKNLLQDVAVVPWMREGIPLLFAGGELVAVADLWIAAESSVENGFQVAWTGHAAIN